MAFLKWVSALLSLLVVAVLGGLGALYFSLQPPTDAPASKVYLLRSGTSLSQVARDLSQAHLLRSPESFSLYARLRGWHQRIQSGYYRLSGSMNGMAILDKLVSGQSEKIPYTIPEGYRIDRAAPPLADYDLSPERYMELAQRPDAELLASFPFAPQASLEGYLYPDTYYLGSSERDLVISQLRRFQELVMPVWERRPANHPLSLADTVKLASVVELEGLMDRELPIIAGVFLERLRIGMKLESDPTVEYAMKRHQGSKGLSFQDIKINSPYNSYLYHGLPPTPIGSPSVKAIEAVIFPHKTPYLFFVAKGDGTHIFSRTYAEHLEAIRKLRAGLI